MRWILSFFRRGANPALAPLVSPMGNFDARVWADSFFEHVERYPDIPRDRGTMTTWFAGAIMTGHDEARRRYESTLHD